MKTVKFGKVKKALQGRGFLIALVLSITAVGASTYLAYNQAISKIGEIGEMNGAGNETDYTEIFGGVNQPVGKEQSGVPLDRENGGETDVFDDTPPDENTNKPVTTPEASAEEANNFIEPAPPRTMPVEGEIVSGFSNGELVKSKTLGVWKTHDGIDIAAEINTPVKAMSNGTVSEVFSDTLWGVCVTIDHGDGVTGCYFGLDKNVAVVVGQTVSGGDVIASVGNTAEIEIAEAPHLHFAIKKNEQWIDPAAFIAE